MCANVKCSRYKRNVYVVWILIWLFSFALKTCEHRVSLLRVYSYSSVTEAVLEYLTTSKTHVILLLFIPGSCPNFIYLSFLHVYYLFLSFSYLHHIYIYQYMIHIDIHKTSNYKLRALILSSNWTKLTYLHKNKKLSGCCSKFPICGLNFFFFSFLF